MAITRAFKNAPHQRRRQVPLVINGDMQIAQRGTADVTGLGDGDEGYVLHDRMRHTLEAGAGRYTCKQTADAPSDSGFSNCLELDCTTADTSIAATEVFNIDYRMEGQDLQYLKYGTSDAEYLTVGFWMKADAAVVYSVGFIEIDNSRSIRQVFTTGTDWTYHCIPFIGDTVSGPNNDIGEGLRLRFTFHGGSNFTSGTLATAWQATTAANTHVGGGSFFASTDRSIKMTGLQLERGYFTAETMPEFQFQSRIDNLRRCQRYFHIGVGLDGNTTGFANGSFRTNATAQILHQFPVSMRTDPTATQIATDNIIAHDTADGNNINVDSIESILFNCENNIIVQYTLEGTAAGAGDGCYVYPTGSTPGIKFEAEL